MVLLYSLDRKPGGLLSKMGIRRRTSPLEIHYKQGVYFRGGLTFGRGLTIQTLHVYSNEICNNNNMRLYSSGLNYVFHKIPPMFDGFS